MQEIVLESGTLPDANAVVRSAVETLGGAVSEQSLSRTRFDALRPSGETFARAGYVGTYQAFGSKDVRVRVRVWAQWPRRVVLLVLAAGFVGAVLLLLVRPSESAWFFAALASWGGLALALLVLAATREVSRGIERDLAEAIRQTLAETTGARVWTRDEWQTRGKRLGEAAKAKVKAVRARGPVAEVQVPAPPGVGAAPGEAPARRRRWRRPAAFAFGRTKRGREEE